MIGRLVVAVALLILGCEAPKTSPPSTAAQTGTAAPPRVIEAGVWGTTTPEAQYEVRELPDGTPGLFDADGRLLLELLPELVFDGGPADKPRPIPTTRRFELLKLTPNPEGGFALYGRITDDLVQAHDLVVESGPNDPRIHVGLTSKWARDVRLQRVALRFRLGQLDGAKGLGHDFTWTEIDDEWVTPAHVPATIVFADQLTLVNRTPLDGLSATSDDGRWHVDVIAFDHESHPVETGEACDAELDGAIARANSRTHSRVDFILGPTALPFVLRFPGGRKAAVSLNDVHEGGARAFVRTEVDAAAVIAARPAAWVGPSLDALPCAEGRFATLTKSGVDVVWAGTTMVSSGANLLAPTETDSRRVFAFRHPEIGAATLFSVGDEKADSGWFERGAIDRLLADRGLLVANEPLDVLLGRDASATQTVRDALAADLGEELWLVGVDEVARRLADLSEFDLTVAPDGVVVMRNTSTRDLRGVTLLLPDGATPAFSTGIAHRVEGQTVWFDLAAGAKLTMQLLRAGTPTSVARSAKIAVKTTP